jgi:hypothetical protein
MGGCTRVISECTHRSDWNIRPIQVRTSVLTGVPCRASEVTEALAVCHRLLAPCFLRIALGIRSCIGSIRTVDAGNRSCGRSIHPSTARMDSRMRGVRRCYPTKRLSKAPIQGCFGSIRCVNASNQSWMLSICPRKRKRRSFERRFHLPDCLYGFFAVMSAVPR